MRIAIDIQGIQSEGSRSRGIGRYSYEIIKNILNIYPSHDFILVANSSLPDLRIEYKNFLNYKNVTYFEWYAPVPLDYISNNKTKKKLANLLRSYSFSCLNVDIILLTSFLEGFSDNCLTGFDYQFINTPIVSIFYDLIPLIHPSLYLNSNPSFARYYNEKLKGLKNLDGLLAISQSSAEEAIKYLNFNVNNVFNISSACDKSIFNENKNSNFESALDIESYTPFILYSGASDPRKNVKSLLKAFSELPISLNQYKLLLVGKLLTPEIELIDKWINLFNIDPRKVIKTGYISDFDLVEVYQKCSLFVFPSLHEGFGLPVLEAMSCGAAVIGSNCTSIPEVIGLKKALFDPYDYEDIKTLIIRGLTDDKFLDDLKLNAKVQSNKFSWLSTAKSAIKACEVIVNSSSQRSSFSNFETLSRNNKEQFQLLIKKIKRVRNFSIFKDEILYRQVAASIAKINSQIDSIARRLFIQLDNISWTVEGPFDSSYSLSILNRCFTQTLNSRINKLSLINTEGFGDYEINIEYLKQYPTIYSIYNTSKSNKDISDLTSRNMYPPRVHDMKSKLNILHSYGWEESGFPSDWVEDFNIYLQGITVMSAQVKKILIDNGVNIPIRVAGLGVNHFETITSSSDFIIKAKKYKFLHISSCFPRKGIEILLKAFSNVFTINDDVTLIIKTFKNPHNNIQLLLDKLKKKNSLFPDVVLIFDELNDGELKSLYLQSNALVAPSRGEGFGFPLAEAMLLNIPVITTNWGGQTDFCNSQNSWLIDYKFVESKSHFDLYLSSYVEPSVTHLSSLLEEVYYSTHEKIKAKTLRAKEKANSLTWENVVEENIDFIHKDLTRYINNYSKIGWLSPWNEKCGIASYSKHLIESMPDEIIVFSKAKNITSNKEFQDFSSAHFPCIYFIDFNQLFTEIISSNITSLVIQFNYNLYDYDDLSTLIDNLSKHNINIILTLHSTIDPVDSPHLALHYLQKSLTKCNRILVHNIDDLNRLKAIGLVNNVSLFPHGILNSNLENSKTFNLKIFPNKKNRISIASFGFCLPNKGFLELISAIHILRKSNIKVKLNIYSAIYSENYFWVYQELVDLVNTLNLENEVMINNNYLSEYQLLKCLSKHDAIVFPYQLSNESSSASVRDGLATLKPVLVTPIPIFNDISKLVDYLPGTSSEDIASGLLSWYESRQMKSGEYIQSNIQRMKLINNLSFSKLGGRLYSMIQSLEIN